MEPEPPEEDRELRVLLASYPDLGLRTGGLQLQIAESANALRALGVDAQTMSVPGFKPDVVHVFGANVGTVRWVRLGLPTVVSPIVSSPLSWRSKLISLRSFVRSDVPDALAQAEVLRRADRLIALSSHELSLLEARGHGSKSSIIANAGDHILRAVPVRPEGVRSVGAAVLMLGRVESNKNQRFVATALKGSTHELILAGPCGDQRYLEQCLSANPNTRYLGNLVPGEVRWLLESCLCLVMASHHEGLPIVVAEASSLGMPVLYSSNLPQIQSVAGSRAFSDRSSLVNGVTLATAVARGGGMSKAVADPPVSWKDVGMKLQSVYEELRHASA